MTELAVLLNGARAGTLLGDGRDLRFVYDAEYQNRNESTPLSLSMPLALREHTDRVVSPWIAGLLPDNVDVLRRWARMFGLSSTEPIDLLSTPIGEDCAGAVQFVLPSRVESLANDPGRVEWLTDEQVGERLHDLRVDETAWLGPQSASDGDGRQGQFSLAGRQRKTALLFEGRWGVPSGRVPTTHILKPPIERVGEDRLYDQEVNEHLCLTGARRAGLAAARSTVISFARQRAIVLTRYDRRRVGSEWLRVHQEDLAQALSVAPKDKYQVDGGPGPRQIAALFRSALPAREADDATERFALALAWNWIIGGTDAHAKNYSILLAGSTARLAPLYDITSGLVYWGERNLRMAMKIGDDYRLFKYEDPWPAMAGELGLRVDWLHEQVLALCQTAPDAMSDATTDPEIRTLGSRLPARLADAVAARSKGCLRLLDGDRRGSHQ